ncbi:hypothetical protein BpHYR1_038614 [Brachionus plicatilis]|uniref:Uncharacterized protein n=1 Tax=Brachionus plicatilis TaxID=10195 RepID=A0A3M7QLT6_BRAPC|nr:hypothetical protein BpHYR1_038614 [Brachionus plicatilis]
MCVFQSVSEAMEKYAIFFFLTNSGFSLLISALILIQYRHIVNHIFFHQNHYYNPSRIRTWVFKLILSKIVDN